MPQWDHTLCQRVMERLAQRCIQHSITFLVTVALNPAGVSLCARRVVRHDAASQHILVSDAAMLPMDVS
jgi:hypothetical protein